MIDKERENYERLLKAIIDDNIEEFSSLVKSTATKSIRFGRFPLLSLLYLYGSKRILKVYEKELCRIQIFTLLPEDYGIYLRFKEKAGRALRLYTFSKNLITPLEMLAILGEDYHLSKSFSDFYKTEESSERIEKIYRLKWQRKAEIKDNQITIARGPLGKQRAVVISSISSVALCVAIVALVLALILPTLVGGDSQTDPFLVKGNNQAESLFAHDAIKFSSLQTDATVKGNYGNFSGEIEGNGKTVVVDGNYLFTEFSGVIKNITLVFTKDQSIKENSALFAKTNTGELDNVTIKFVDKKVSYAHKEGISDQERSEGVKFIPFVLENIGVLKNCNLEISATLEGESSTNGYFAGFVSVNKGLLENCKILPSSSIQASCVDMGGLCITNDQQGVLKNCENNASLTQKSNSTGWNPNTAGIVVTNDGLLENCKNSGDITSIIEETSGESALESIATGCVINNNGEITGFVNEGKITSENSLLGDSITPSAYAGGIALSNKNLITKSENKGKVYAKSPFFAIVGGISAINFGIVYEDINRGEVEVFENGNITVETQTSTVYVGGICGRNSYDSEAKSELYFVGKCENHGEIKAYGRSNAWVGGLVGYSETYTQESKNFGKITAYGGNEVVAGGLVGGQTFVTQNGFYQEAGFVTLCFSNCALEVSTSENGTAFAGGGAGFVYAGAVVYSVFANTFTLDEKVNAGVVVGLLNGGTVQGDFFLNAEGISNAVGKIASTGGMIEGNSNGCTLATSMEELESKYNELLKEIK